jgi:hypothetical protein
MEPLAYDFPGLFGFEEAPEFPALEPPDTGLRIHARRLQHDGETLSFELLVTYRFPRSFCRTFQRFDHALSCMLEDTETGQSAVFRLIDMHKKYPAMQGTNFRGATAPEASPRSFQSGYVLVPLRIPLPSPSVHRPTLFVTVFLQHHVSNTLAFQLREGSVETFLGGRAIHLPTLAELARQRDLDEEEEPETSEQPAPPALAPEPGPPAGLLRLTARGPGPFARGEPLLLEAALALTPEGLAEAGADGWLRSLFVCATRQDNQTSVSGPAWGERLLFADDVRRERLEGREWVVLRASFELAEALGTPLRRGVHYLQASSRQFRSPVLELACE